MQPSRIHPVPPSRTRRGLRLRRRLRRRPDQSSSLWRPHATKYSSRWTRKPLRHVQDLMRREVASGDAGVIFARALVLLEQQAEKKAFSATTRFRPTRPTKPGSRTVPANVERQVWTRDGGRCAFIGRSGMRCSARSFLEFHHREPHALGGPATVENIALRCRAHNAYESELLFGRFAPAADREWLPEAR